MIKLKIELPELLESSVVQHYLSRPLSVTEHVMEGAIYIGKRILNTYVSIGKTNIQTFRMAGLAVKPKCTNVYDHYLTCSQRVLGYLL